MQQTLLSLVALLVVTLLSFNQMQSSIQSQKQTVRAEMEMMALGVAMQTMEVVRARAFDSRTVGVPTGEYLDPKSDNFAQKGKGEFSPPGGASQCKLHPGGSGIDCAAVEQFHGTEGKVPFPLAESSVPFNVKVEVYYVCEDMTRATKGGCSPPTGQKEVVLKVQDAQPEGRPHRLPNRITYSEVVAYP